MFVPKKKQFKKWSVPSKWSYISGIVGLIALVFAIYFGFWPRSSKALQLEEMEEFAGVVLRRVLEGSSLCCEIKTLQFIVNLPEETNLQIHAESFIGIIPESTDGSDLTFSFSPDQRDSIHVFNCSNVGEHDVDIYFFKNAKVFCMQTAILDLRDPEDFCNLEK